MPCIGIIRGFGEGYIATGYIIELLKALNRRFRSKLSYKEIPAGDCMRHGCSLSKEAISQMNDCDCIYIGDMRSSSNPLEYGCEDIAMAFSDNIEYACITGFGKHSDVDVHIASYFDGGTRLREGTSTINGCSEMRMCSAYSAKNIVKNVSDKCETRRRRLAFVKDGDNEYCADLFSLKFESYTLPLSNFHFIKFTLKDICHEIVYNPAQFDTIFASKTFSELAAGIYSALMKEDFTFYNKYTNEKTIYSVRALESNSHSGDYVPSLCSYIMALCDLLKNEFGKEKESVHLCNAVNDALNCNYTPGEAELFFNAVIENLQKPVETKYWKNTPKSRRII